ncbi:MAG: hypothetical protein FJ146_04475 [Deltaproteobacteria bacterium]|nr:hypothetical protein [Deltaproteobacteria bacterium]
MQALLQQLGQVVAKRQWRILVILMAVLRLLACGADQNILGRTVPSEHKKDFENQLDMARTNYDRGKFDVALRHASNALALNPESEQASILYGFINLGLAGGDPFNLAQALIAAKGASGEGAAATMTALKTAIGLTMDELQSLGTLDRTVEDLPLILPSCAETVRSSVPRLNYLNEAVLATCPFVSESVRSKLDLRQVCNSTTRERQYADQAHFLWAFTHLTEAVIFNQVFTYATVSPPQTNLQLRVARVTGSNQAANNPDTYINAISSLNKTMQSILPSSGICSASARTTQFSATVYDLAAVDAGFAQLAKAPASVRATLTTALGSIRSGQDKVAASGDSTQALRGQLGGGIAEKVAASIDSQVASLPTPLSDEQKTKLCGSFGEIAAGSGKTSKVCSQ